MNRPGQAIQSGSTMHNSPGGQLHQNVAQRWVDQSACMLRCLFDCRTIGEAAEPPRVEVERVSEGFAGYIRIKAFLRTRDSRTPLSSTPSKGNPLLGTLVRPTDRWNSPSVPLTLFLMGEQARIQAKSSSFKTPANHWNDCARIEPEESTIKFSSFSLQFLALPLFLVQNLESPEHTQIKRLCEITREINHVLEQNTVSYSTVGKYIRMLV
jgi:hypothetical protein